MQRAKAPSHHRGKGRAVPIGTAAFGDLRCFTGLLRSEGSRRETRDRRSTFKMKGPAFNLNGDEGRLRDETVLLHFAPERHGADLERFRRLLPIAAKAFERALNHRSFLFLQVQAVIRHTLPCLL
jgi:hypothetical protein